MEKKDIFIIACCISVMLYSFSRSASRRPAPVPSPPTTAINGDMQNKVKPPPASKTPMTNAAIPAPSPLATTPKTSPVEKLQPPPPIDPAATAVWAAYSALPPTSPITLKTKTLSLVLDPALGGSPRIQLPNYHEDDGKTPVTLEDKDHPVFALSPRTGDWQFSPPRIESSTADQLCISRALGTSGLVVRQTWKVNSEDPNNVDYTIEFLNRTKKEITLPELALNCGVMPPLNAPRGFMNSGGMDQRIDVFRQGGTKPKFYVLRSIRKMKDKKVKDLATSPIDWLAVQNKYFAVILDTAEPFAGCALQTWHLSGAGKKEQFLLGGKVFLASRTLPAGAAYAQNFNCYVGPKTFSALSRLGEKKKAIMNFDLFLFFHFGWMEAISRLILWSLKHLHAALGSYGLAIIIITLVFRFSFWPITHQSTRLSRKMKEIQPVIQEIKEKYKEDPQRMWQKTQEVYKENNIHPFMGGCLPMLLQIPVFFALFNVLRSAIELRHARFLWMMDLSQPDTIYTIPNINIPVNPLAFVWGVSMFFMQRLMPTSADPSQQHMMMFMTIFFFFLLYGMPSGLTLYWTISNLVSIFQYATIRRMESNGGTTIPATA